MINLFSVGITLLVCIVTIDAHGYLLDPVARSTAWLVDQSFRQCCTYSNHMEMFCGGIQHQWKSQGGKCGICGEPYDRQNKLFEKGGALYTGKIVKTYRQGEEIDVKVVLTANHRGYFEFRLCSLDSTPDSEATQSCLDRGLLKIAGTSLTRFSVDKYGSETITARVKLPSDMSCRHCVFQWKYTAANSWGTDPVTGQSGLGMGIENETFMGCSDISIVSNGSPTATTTTPVVISTNPATSPTNPASTTNTPAPSTTTQKATTAVTTAATTTTVATTKAATTTTIATTKATTAATTSAAPVGGAKAWSSNAISYKVGDIVTYNGFQYRCVFNHLSYPGAEPGIFTWAWWERMN